MDCQSYVAFVIEVVGTLGLRIGPNITWNEVTLDSTDEPITTGDFRPPFMKHFSDMPMDAAKCPPAWEDRKGAARSKRRVWPTSDMSYPGVSHKSISIADLSTHVEEAARHVVPVTFFLISVRTHLRFPVITFSIIDKGGKP